VRHASTGATSKWWTRTGDSDVAETLQEALARRERYIHALQRAADAEIAERQALSPRYVRPLLVPSSTMPIRTLIGSQGLPHDARLIRRYVEAVALCQGVPSPARNIPKTWEPLVRNLHEVRNRGLSWQTALGEVGLAPPSDLTPYIRERQLELHALWDKLPGIVGRALERTNGIGRENLTNSLRQLLT
jgi:hypothetical protein